MCDINTLSKFLIRKCFSFRFFATFKRMPSTGVVNIRSVDTEDHLSIIFFYKTGRVALRRAKDEQLQKSLERLRLNLEKLNSKKKKRNTINEVNEIGVSEIDVSLTANGVSLPGEVLNKDAWLDDAILTVGDQQFSAVVNAPEVLKLTLPKKILSGFDVYPKIELDFGRIEDAEYSWYKRRLPNEKYVFKPLEDGTTEKETFAPGGWIFTNKGFFFTPTEEDIGRTLRIMCTPRNKDKVGLECCFDSTQPIEPGPKFCPFTARHSFTKELAPPKSFRFISYNILADLYADSEYSRTVLFHYCPPQFLDMNYRKHLIMKELTGYNGDIVCIQEVDRKIFLHDIQPVMRHFGLEGVLHEKGESKGEGVVCLHRTTKFSMLDSHGIVLGKELEENSLFESLLKKVRTNEQFYQEFITKNCVLQVVLLQSIENPNHALLVGNTHLHAKADGDHIRLVQAYMCVAYLEDQMKQLRLQYPHLTINPILSGDFNSCPEFGVYKLMTSGSVSKDCEDWRSNAEEALENVDVSHGLKLGSACGTPQYTNYTPEFDGCLDYIFYDTNGLEVESIVPFPSHEEVTKLKAIPNEEFPSDHLALVCTIKWKNN